jgi:hypothetical protein
MVRLPVEFLTGVTPVTCNNEPLKSERWDCCLTPQFQTDSDTSIAVAELRHILFPFLRLLF